MGWGWSGGEKKRERGVVGGWVGGWVTATTSLTFDEDAVPDSMLADLRPGFDDDADALMAQDAPRDGLRDVAAEDVEVGAALLRVGMLRGGGGGRGSGQKTGAERPSLFSLTQLTIVVRTTRTTASVGSTTPGRGTSIFLGGRPTPRKTVACIICE